MGPSRASPQGRLRCTWGDGFLTVVGVLGTLLALGKATRWPSRKARSCRFGTAYAAGAAVAACWCVYDVRHLQAGRRGRAGGRTGRAAIAMAAPGLVIVGVGLAQAFADLGLQALVFGAVAGFLLSTMLVYGALVLRARRRSGSD
jgi:threonine/homoserine efflux transporter RhtA